MTTLDENIDLTHSPLFVGFSPDEAHDLLRAITTHERQYNKGEYIVRQGDPVQYLILPLFGSVRTEMITKEGNCVEIDYIESLRPLAPAFIFADRNLFPVDVIAADVTLCYFISKQRLLTVLQSNQQLLLNFMRLNSNIAVFLSNKVQMMSLKSLKGKIALFILERTSVQAPTMKLTRTVTQLADHFGVQRPSLSRSLGELVQDGAIAYERGEITVLNRFKLECLL